MLFEVSWGDVYFPGFIMLELFLLGSDVLQFSFAASSVSNVNNVMLALV